MSVVAEFYKNGGTWMHPIAFVSVVVVAVVAERIYFLWFRYNLNAHSFMGQIQKLIMENSVDRAIKLCNAEQHAALPAPQLAATHAPQLPVAQSATPSLCALLAGHGTRCMSAQTAE